MHHKAALVAAQLTLLRLVLLQLLHVVPTESGRVLTVFLNPKLTAEPNGVVYASKWGRRMSGVTSAGTSCTLVVQKFLHFAQHKVTFGKTF